MSNKSYFSLGILPPSDIKIETVVLGCFIVDRNAIESHFGLLSEASFYKEENRLVFQAIQSLVKKLNPVDIITVIKQLRVDGTLDIVGGPQAVTKLANEVENTYNIDFYVKSLQELQLKRLLISVSQQTTVDAYRPDSDALELYDRTMVQLKQLTETMFHAENTKSVGSIADEGKKKIEQAISDFQNGIVRGKKTGLRVFDTMFGDFDEGDLIILAARPSMGKTAIALEIAKRVSSMKDMSNKNIPVLIISMEMTDMALVNRIVIGDCSTQITFQKIKSGNLSNMEMVDLFEQLRLLKEKSIYIDEKAKDPFSITRSIRSFNQEHPGGLVIIDYLQIIMDNNKRSGSNEEVFYSGVTQGLKLLAKELSIPVLLLSQLSRQVEQRGGSKRPILSDLKYSGGIEAHADKVLMLYRDAAYDILVDSEGKSTEGIIELIIRKNRNGSLGTVRWFHNESLTQFSESLDDLERYIQTKSTQTKLEFNASMPSNTTMSKHIPDEWTSDEIDF